MTLLPLALSLMEGFVGVVAAKAFQAPAWVIAVISAAPMFGNLSRLLWNRLAAQPKVPMRPALQCAVLVCVLAVASARAASRLSEHLGADGRRGADNRLLIAGVASPCAAWPGA